MAENDVRNNEQQEDLSELIKVRRDKLRDLQEAGKDPFKEVRFEKTAMSKEIVDNFENTRAKPCRLPEDSSANASWVRQVSRIYLTATVRFSFTLSATFWATSRMRNSKIRHRRHHRRYRRSFRDAHGRNHRQRFVGETSFKVAFAAPRKIPRTYQHRPSLSSALR